MKKGRKLSINVEIYISCMLILSFLEYSLIFKNSFLMSLELQLLCICHNTFNKKHTQNYSFNLLFYMVLVQVILPYQSLQPTMMSSLHDHLNSTPPLLITLVLKTVLEIFSYSPACVTPTTMIGRPIYIRLLSVVSSVSSIAASPSHLLRAPQRTRQPSRPFWFRG